jgi:hypothetical protein
VRAHALDGAGDVRGEHRLGGDRGMVEEAVAARVSRQPPQAAGMLTVGFSPSLAKVRRARRFRR